MCLQINKQGTNWIRSMDEVIEVWKMFKPSWSTAAPYLHVAAPYQGTFLKRGEWLTATGGPLDINARYGEVAGGAFHAYRRQEQARGNAYSERPVIRCFMLTKECVWGKWGDICAPHIFISRAGQAKDPDFSPDYTTVAKYEGD
jgi:hypothetical protein